MTVYLSGAMTGLPNYNYRAFNRAAATLRMLGYDVFNPAESFDGDTTLPRATYMRKDIEALLTVDAVVVLPGWEQSKGASLEVAIARELGLPVIPFDATIATDAALIPEGAT